MANRLEEWAHHATPVTDHQCSYVGGISSMPLAYGIRWDTGRSGWTCDHGPSHCPQASRALHTWKMCRDLWALYPPLIHVLPPCPPNSASTGPSQRLPTGCSSIGCATTCILVVHSQFTSPLRRFLPRGLPRPPCLRSFHFISLALLNAGHCLQSWPRSIPLH